MGSTGRRDSHVRVLAYYESSVLPSQVYLLENSLFSVKRAVYSVKVSFSAGFSLNKAMCQIVAGVLFLISKVIPVVVCLALLSGRVSSMSFNLQKK